MMDATMTHNTRRLLQVCGGLAFGVALFMPTAAAQRDDPQVAVIQSVGGTDLSSWLDPRTEELFHQFVTTEIDEGAVGFNAWVPDTLFFPHHLKLISIANAQDRDLLKFSLRQASAGVYSGTTGALKSSLGNSSRWAFRVESESLPLGTVVPARISGRFWVDGDVWVYGSGSACLDASLTVRNRLNPDLGFSSRARTVASQELWSTEIRHSYEWTASLGLNLAVGDGAEISGNFGASRDFGMELIELRDKRVPFALAVLLQVGETYELDFTLAAEVENRGLTDVHQSGVKLGEFLDVPSFTGLGAEPLVGPSDPSHLLDAKQFFDLDLPNLSIGKTVKGGANFGLPSLGAFFGGSNINVSNNLKIAPLGEFDNVQEMFDTLGITPDSLGVRMATAGGTLVGVSSDGLGSPDSLIGGGACFESLRIDFMSP